MIPTEVWSVARSLLDRFETEVLEDEDEEVRLAFFEDKAREFAWGWALPFSTLAAVQGLEPSFPTGPVIVLRKNMEAFVGPSAVSIDGLTEYLRQAQEI
jgi:hypothetical protein